MTTSSFWSTFLRAVEAEPREAKKLRGVSGLDHPFAAVGVDVERHRLVLITNEADPRTAAFAQSDIQAAFPNTKVIAARVEIVDRKTIVDTARTNKTQLATPEDFKRFLAGPVVTEALQRSAQVFSPTGDPEDEQKYTQVVKAMFSITVALFLQTLPPEHRDLMAAQLSPGAEAQHFDGLVGLGTIPLYRFSEANIDVFKMGKGLEEPREILRRLNIFQYFFPPPDQFVLGLVETASPTSSALLSQLDFTEQRGHPFGANEILASQKRLPDVIDDLRDRGYIVEAERTLEITEQGRSVRETVKVQPREGLISKIIGQFSLKLDLKDLFPK